MLTQLVGFTHEARVAPGPITVSKNWPIPITSGFNPQVSVDKMYWDEAYGCWNPYDEDEDVDMVSSPLPDLSTVSDYDDTTGLSDEEKEEVDEDCVCGQDPCACAIYQDFVFACNDLENHRTMIHLEGFAHEVLLHERLTAAQKATRDRYVSMFPKTFNREHRKMISVGGFEHERKRKKKGQPGKKLTPAEQSARDKAKNPKKEKFHSSLPSQVNGRFIPQVRKPGSGGGRIGPSVKNAAGPKTDLEKYIESLVTPESDKSALCRVPTRNSKFSSTFQSVQTFPITYNADWTTDQGRFCLLVKPILGDAGGAGGAPAPPTAWKCCLADGTLGFWQRGGTWTSSNSYVPYTGGKDLRVDKFTPFFTAPDSFLSRYTGNVGTGTYTLKSPLGTLPDVSEQNITTAYQVAPGGYGLTLLGAGNYLVTLIMSGTGITAASLIAYLPPGSNVIPGTLGTQYQVTSIGFDTSNDMTSATFVWALTLFQSMWVGYTVTGTTIISGYQFLSQVYQQFNSNTQAGGAIDRIRPISMSVIITCTVAKLVNGGTIVGKLLNKSQCSKEFFQDITNAETGQFQDWNAIADTGNVYNGAFEDGARVIWLPEDDSDVDFYTPDEMNDHDYPCALISGQFTPGQTGFPSGQIARAIVVTNYEFTTSYTCLAGEKISGNDILMSEAFNIMNTMPTATMNGAHWDFVKKIMGRAAQGAKQIGSWAWANRETIMGVGKGIASLASAV